MNIILRVLTLNQAEDLDRVKIDIRSDSILFPADTHDLGKYFSLIYGVNSEVYNNISNLMPLKWRLYADEMPPKEGVKPLSELNEF